MMNILVTSKKRLSLTVAAMALISVLSTSAYASTAPADVPTGNTMGTRKKTSKDFPEMTADDCRDLAANRRKYKKSEYMSRKEYCRQMDKGGASKEGTSVPSGGATTAPDAGSDRMDGSAPSGSSGTRGNPPAGGIAPDMGTGGPRTGAGSGSGDGQ